MYPLRLKLINAYTPEVSSQNIFYAIDIRVVQEI